MSEFDIQRRMGAAFLRLPGVEGISLENSEGGGRVNSFWKFLPNCFSTQSFNILKAKVLKSEEEKKTNQKRISHIGSGGEV